MRIGVVSDSTSPWSRDVALFLARLGNEVHFIDAVVTGRPGYLSASTQSAGIEELRKGVAAVHQLSAPFRHQLAYLYAAPQLGALLRRTQCDVAVALYAGGFGLCTLVSRFRPYVVYAVGSDILMAKGFARVLRRKTLECAAFTAANGFYLAQRARVLAPNANIEPLLLGVDCSEFRPVQGAEPRKCIKLICSRGFKPVYNNRYIIEALGCLEGAALEFELVFASPGPELAAVQEFAKQTLSPTLYQRVRFLGGVSRAQLVSLLQDSDVYLSVARSDGTSTAVLEALACGLFPILSDIPQNRDWVDDQARNGAIVPLDRPDLLANAIRSAIENSEMRERARGYNRELVLRRANIADTMRAFEAKLREVVQQHRASVTHT